MALSCSRGSLAVGQETQGAVTSCCLCYPDWTVPASGCQLWLNSFDSGLPSDRDGERVLVQPPLWKGKINSSHLLETSIRSSPSELSDTASLQHNNVVEKEAITLSYFIWLPPWPHSFFKTLALCFPKPTWNSIIASPSLSTAPTLGLRIKAWNTWKYNVPIHLINALSPSFT